MKYFTLFFASFLLCYLFTPFANAQTLDDPFKDVDKAEGNVLAPDNQGCFMLKVEEASSYKVEIKTHQDKFFATRGWNENEGRLTWQVNAPEEGIYNVEICWCTDDANKRDLLFYLNDKETIKWNIVHTSGNAPRYPTSAFTMKIGTITLPSGISKISVAVPNPRNWGYIDLNRIRLTPVKGLVEKLNTIRKSPRLGQSMEHLRLLWGIDVPVSGIDASPKNCKGDEDAALFAGVNNKLKTIRWNMQEISITGFFLNNKCVALCLKITPNPEKSFIWEMVRNFLPGIEVIPKNQPGNYTIYSEDKYYQIQFWEDLFYLKSPGLLKEELGDKAKEINDRFRQLESLPKLGMTLDEISSLWGQGAERKDPLTLLPDDKGSLDDWAYLAAIKPLITCHRWTNPKGFNQDTSAIFWQDKIVAFDINLGSPQKITQPNEYAKVLKYLIPEIKFSSPPPLKKENFVIYSSSPKNSYRFHYVHSRWIFFILSSTPLIWEIHKPDAIAQRAQAKHIVKTLSQSPELLKTSFFDIPLDTIDSIITLGGDGPLIDNKKTRAWNFPDCDVKLVVTYEKIDDHEYCKDIFICSPKTRIMDSEAGILIANQLTHPVQLPVIPQNKVNTWFVVPSKEPSKQFILSRGFHNSLGIYIRIQNTKLPEKKKTNALIEQL